MWCVAAAQGETTHIHRDPEPYNVTPYTLHPTNYKMNKLALSAVVAGLLVVTSSASAQVCNGIAPFSAGKMRGGFGVRMPNNSTIWDGEFAVGLRSGAFFGDRAYLYAGNGIVKDSDPASEYAETKLKLASLSAALHVAR